MIIEDHKLQRMIDVIKENYVIPSTFNGGMTNGFQCEYCKCEIKEDGSNHDDNCIMLLVFEIEKEIVL